MDNPLCEKKRINWNKGYCSLVNPENKGDFCRDFEDAMDFLRLKADRVEGTLG